LGSLVCPIFRVLGKKDFILQPVSLIRYMHYLQNNWIL
jgi:poly(3-hydroxyalkanoate) synthetase